MFNNSHKLSFKCRACNSFIEEMPKDNKDFMICGYDNIIEWSDFLEDDILPDIGERIWARSDTLPQESSVRIVKAQPNFSFAVGEEFWTIYSPALAALNGWDDYPEDIGKSALIRCSLKEVINYDEYSAWVVVAIKKVILFSDIANEYREKRVRSDYLESLSIYGTTYLLEYGDWLYFACSAEGDIGSWCLIKKNKDNYCLVLYNEWGFHEDFFYADNILIDYKEVNEMINRSEKM